MGHLREPGFAPRYRVMDALLGAASDAPCYLSGTNRLVVVWLSPDLARHCLDALEDPV